jgi:hypothetical protein
MGPVCQRSPPGDFTTERAEINQQTRQATAVSVARVRIGVVTAKSACNFARSLQPAFGIHEYSPSQNNLDAAGHWPDYRSQPEMGT